MADFEKNHPGFVAQKLWKLFEEKAEEQGLGRDFVSAVGEVCAIGLNLSKFIVRFFPTFTLHDETHSAKVCRWMWVLLGDRAKELTAHEAALLLMAACCHDVGMAVSPEQEAQMRLRTYPGWDDYFRQNLKDDTEYCRTGVISDRMLRKFVRMHHHERIGENLRQSDWPDTLLLEELDWELLLKLCRSHGTELTDAELNYREGLYDLRMCAVVLRLADLLDFDAGRAPEVLFRQMGLDRPRDAESWRSAEEYQKNRAGNFREKFLSGRIPYVAAYNNPGVEQEIRKYLDWVDRELTNCRNCLSQSASYWKNLDLPYRVDDEKVQRKGYAAGKFCMTMDQDKILDLLTGENLYSDAGVFVRELLQNSIDAVLMRTKQDPNFSLEDGLIQIDTWMDEEANNWFRIRDNGTGMNERIIQNHFLKVGNSYYTSEDFQYDNRHAPKGSYTAISRFGIGILSCFMGDKEHTQLKVSTKRFDEGPKSGIRLDVTGLHGFYFLCKEKKHPENEPWFPKMPSYNEDDRGYRKEPGTTVCVNVNLLRMGDLRSIREILDKYVQFPKIRVIYNDPDTHKEYPTQQELMAAVYALNPDGVVKEYVHEIPDWAFKGLKAKFPYHTWIRKPVVTFQYEPLDWRSGSKNLSGIRCDANTGASQGKLKEDLSPRTQDRFRMSHFMAIINKIDIHGIEIEYCLRGCDLGLYDKYQSDIQDMWNGIHINIPFNEFPLSTEEKRIWDILSNYNQEGKGNVVSYNGVILHEKPRNKFCSILMSEDFRPEVNIARNEITRLPLEALCCLEMGNLDRIFNDSMIAKDDSWKLATEQDYQEVLSRHPDWWVDFKEGYLLHGISDNTILRENLRLAYWKQQYQIYEQGHNLLPNLKESADGLTADFPVSMFAWSENPCLLKWIYKPTMKFYNRTHAFSKWLIANRAALAEQIPALYSIIIQTMMLSYNERVICDTLNAIIDMLRRYQENCFCIPADLVITESDFST